MNPLHLSARNYRSFAELDLDIPEGCAAIVGDNGAGKSSIINLIDLALFGSRSLGSALSDDAGDEEMVIVLEFEHRGETYRVRRTYSGRGRGKSSIDFESSLSEEAAATYRTTAGLAWNPLTRENAAATQALIEETIGLSRETFRSSAFLAQGDGAAFTEAQPRDRKRILAEVLALDVWDRLLERARRDLAAVRDKASRLQIQVEQAEHELEAKPETIDRVGLYERDAATASVSLEKAEADHKAAADDLARSREETAKLEAAQEILATRERELEQLVARLGQVQQALEGAADLPKLRADSEALAARRPAIEADLEAAREGEAARAEHKHLTTERDRLVAKTNEFLEQETTLRIKIDTLESTAPATCDRCEQPLQAEARDRALASMLTEADQDYANATQLQGEADTLLAAIELTAEAAARGPNAAKQAELQNSLRVAILAETTLATISEREKRVNELETELAQIRERRPALETARVDAVRDVKEITAKVGPLDDYAVKVARSYAVVIEARSDAEATKQRLAVAQAELKRLEGVEALAAENSRALEQQHAELDLLTLAERAYGRDGIPALIIESSAIPQIEAEADRILAELGTDFRIELRTQRELKSREGLAEALDIVVIGPAGARPYETFSGGERTRLNLALRIALARLLAHRRGAEVRMLAIDEPDGLDAAGFAALSTTLQRLTDDFDSILVISHHPDLATAFDQTIQIEKVNGRSQIAGAREAVAA